MHSNNEPGKLFLDNTTNVYHFFQKNFLSKEVQLAN